MSPVPPDRRDLANESMFEYGSRAGIFRMLRLFGAARLSLVTYLMPPIALVYGALLLDEPITAGAVAGLALILGGVAVGSGAVRMPRREPATVVSRP